MTKIGVILMRILESKYMNDKSDRDIKVARLKLKLQNSELYFK